MSRAFSPWDLLVRLPGPTFPSGHKTPAVDPVRPRLLCRRAFSACFGGEVMDGAHAEVRCLFAFIDFGRLISKSPFGIKLLAY